MFIIIQILAVVLLSVAVVFYFVKIKRKRKSLAAGLVLCIALSAIISNAVLKAVPLPTDKVVVTALGEKNESASADEVCITGLIVGGEEYELKNPSEGKWFWKGDVYMWRNESDPRQPEGTTRSITISIPYGKDRSIQFGLGKWNGIVEVCYDGDTQCYDLFKSSDETVLYAPVANTASLPLYGIKLLRIGLFVLIIALLMAYPVYAVVKFDYDKIIGYFQSNWDKYYYIALALIYIALLQKNSIGGSLWGDEIWQLGWYYDPDVKDSYTAFDLISKLWLNIMPYGHEYLRLLSQIFIAGAIFFAGMAGKVFKGKRFGILLSSSVAFSLTIADLCAKGIRPYAMLLFCMTLILYLYLKKHKNLGAEKTSDLIICGFAMALTMDTHPFGLVLVGLFLVSDFVLIMLKKASKKILIEFIAPAAYGIYWLILQWKVIGNNVSAGTVTVSKMFETVRWLFSYNDVLILFALFGFVTIAVNSMVKIKNHTFDFKGDYEIAIISAAPIAEFALVFIYSTVIDPAHSLFFDRYFIATAILLLFVMCYGIDKAIDCVCRLSDDKSVSKCASILVILGLCIYNWTQISPWVKNPSNGRSRNDDYKSVADYVMQQNDIYDTSTLVLINHGQSSANIGFSYYLTHNGERDDINHTCMFHLPKDLDQYAVIYIAYDRYDGRWSKVIDEQYELVDNNTSVKVKKYVRK